jgi:hypothetical protein
MSFNGHNYATDRFLGRKLHGDWNEFKVRYLNDIHFLIE